MKYPDLGVHETGSSQQAKGVRRRFDTSVFEPKLGVRLLEHRRLPRILTIDDRHPNRGFTQQ